MRPERYQLSRESRPSIGAAGDYTRWADGIAAEPEYLDVFAQLANRDATKEVVRGVIGDDRIRIKEAVENAPHGRGLGSIQG